MKTLARLTVDDLRECDVFQNIPAKELSTINEMVEHQSYNQGETIIREEEVGDSFFILLEGVVRIEKRIDEQNTELLGFFDQVGGLFGEMSLVEDRPRSAGIIADKDCRVLTVSKQGFLTLVDQFPAFTLEVARNIAHFLRKTDQRLIHNLKRENEDLKRINRQLEETQDELIGKERLSLIGRMASTILHDMKNPMSTIGGYAQILKMKAHSREDLVKYSDIINKQVERFLGMAQDLLSFAQGGEQMKFSSVNIDEYLRECTEVIMQRFKEQGVNFVTDFNFSGKVRIDTGRFYRAVENIASNALDILEPGGTFTLSTAEVETGVRITLADDGVGMSEEIRANAFKEFFTQGKKKGTGLGLAIVKRVVDEHDGLIRLDSEMGKGTTFMIDLPAIGYHLLPKAKHQIPIPFAGESRHSDSTSND